MKKYFEYTGWDSTNKSGEASKFWEISIDGSTINIRFGKIGVAKGQSTVKEFDTGKEALAQSEKLIKEKTKKGCVEMSGATIAERVEAAEMVYQGWVKRF